MVQGWEENATGCTYRSHNERVGMWYVVLYEGKGQKCSRKAGDIHFCISAFKELLIFMFASV
jgi:hypothetical protein